MTKKMIAVIAASGTALAGTALAFFMHAGAATQTDSKTALNQDLIQAKVALEGWQKEANQGNLASADYKSAFATDLATMHDKFQSDAQSF